MMKKTLCILLAAITVSAAGLTSCGGSESSSKAGDAGTVSASDSMKAVDVSAAADRFKNEIKWVDSLNELESGMIEKVIGVSADLYSKGKVYIGSGGATAEEIAVFEAKDTDSAEKIMDAYKKRIEAQKKAFENYQPKELDKLNDPLLTCAKQYVFVCISDERSKAMEIVSELI